MTSIRTLAFTSNYLSTNSMKEQPHIWHNPRCSKSRQTLLLLQELGYQPQVVDYLKNPPDATTIAQALKALGMQAKELLRKGEAPFTQLALDKANQQACIAAMVNHPILIERPIVLYRGKAAIGRPPENIQQLFKGP